MRYLLLSLLFLCACGGYHLVGPSGTEQETFVLSETARFAGILGVNVHGELTDTIFWVEASNPQYPGEKVYAAGWYNGGVAYYYRPWLVQQGMSTVSYIAAHEVCHAKHKDHDASHAQCVNTLLGGVN